MAKYTMPSLGADMQSGTLLEWNVKPGDEVKRGDIIAVIGTEKGDIEAEVFDDGVIQELLVEEGTEVPVGQAVALIRSKGEPEVAPVREKPAAVKEAEAALAQETTAGPAVQPSIAGNGHRIRISPLARKLADELGVDVSRVRGSGPHGAIGKEDVEKAAQASAREVERQPKPPPVGEKAPPPVVTPQREPVDFQAGMRRAIALAMARANRDIPHYYLQTPINMSKALTWLEAENQKRSIKDRVLPVVLLIKAVARGLVKVPQLNGFWVDDGLQIQEAIHIGFAVALRQGGLITPAIHHADLKSMDELMENVRDVIMRTRSGRLRTSEMTDATITLTSLGDMGVQTVYGVIYPPQVALVGFGKITDQVWVENGMLGVRPVLVATLAGDHRATDGRTGAQFLDSVNQLLQAPAALWEE